MPAAPALGPERRAALDAARLRAAVATLPAPAAPGGDPPPVAEPFARGSALVQPAGGPAWILLDDRASRALGPAMAWAARRHASALHLLVPAEVGEGGAAGVVARRAALFADAPAVWVLDGASARPAPPAAWSPPAPPPPAAAAFEELLAAAGLEVVVEGGTVRGEVLGLEVAVVTVADDGTARLEVGVGRHDREAFGLLHGDRPDDEALRSVVDAVAPHRRPGADAHPLNRLAPERWLRSWAMGPTGPLAAWDLARTEGTEPRLNVKEPVPALAHGRRPDGREVVVAFSTGVDVDLVPVAADARQVLAPDGDLVLVVPARDRLPVTEELAAALVRPAEVLAVPDGWRA